MKRPAAIFGVIVAFMMSAYSVFSLVYVMKTFSTVFHVTIGLISLAVTLSFFGGAVGGVVLGRIADVRGRKPALLLSVIIFSVATIFASHVTSLLELYLSWFAVGFGANAENGISYAIIVELLKGSRGLVGGAVQGLYFIGMMLDVLTIMLIEYWRTYMAVVGIISLIASVAGILMVPETSVKGANKQKLGEIFRGSLIPVTVLGTLLVAASFLYTIPIATLVPSALKSGNLLALDAAGFLSFTFAGYLSDIIKRGKAVIVFAAIGAISSISVAFLGIGMGTAIAMYVGTGYFAFVGIMISELYPMSLRGTGSNFAFLLGRIMGGIGPSMAALIFAGNIGVGIAALALISSLLAILSSTVLMRYSYAKQIKG